jgi:uncharacterized protein (DUF433 family)
VSGACLFKGTRVPVKALCKNIEEGASVDDFIEWFPGVAWSDTGTVIQQHNTEKHFGAVRKIEFSRLQP